MVAPPPTHPSSKPRELDWNFSPHSQSSLLLHFSSVNLRWLIFMVSSGFFSLFCFSYCFTSAHVFCFVFRYTNSSNWLFWFRVNSHMDPVIKKTFLMLCTLFLVPPKQLWSVGALTQPLQLPLSVCLWDTDSGSFRSYGFRSGASVALVSSSHRADVQSDWGSVKFRG